MCESRGVVGGPDPPGKSQVIWVSIEISIWAPLEKVGPPSLVNVGPPLDPWKKKFFSVIKTLDPSVNWRKLRSKKKSGCFLAVGHAALDPPWQNSWIRAWRCAKLCSYVSYLPRGAMVRPVIFDCGISWSYTYVFVFVAPLFKYSKDNKRTLLFSTWWWLILG